MFGKLNYFGFEVTFARAHFDQMDDGGHRFVSHPVGEFRICPDFLVRPAARGYARPTGRWPSGRLGGTMFSWRVA